MNTNGQISITLDRALELHRCGDLAAAGEACSQLLDPQPKNHDAHYGLGMVRMQLGCNDAQVFFLEARCEHIDGNRDAEPEKESRRLANFCGLNWQPSCLDVHERRHASYTFSETQVRAPINAKGVGRWRNYAEYLTPFVDACVANGVRLPDN